MVLGGSKRGVRYTMGRQDRRRQQGRGGGPARHRKGHTYAMYCIAYKLEICSVSFNTFLIAKLSTYKYSHLFIASGNIAEEISIDLSHIFLMVTIPILLYVFFLNLSQ